MNCTALTLWNGEVYAQEDQSMREREELFDCWQISPERKERNIRLPCRRSTKIYVNQLSQRQAHWMKE